LAPETGKRVWVRSVHEGGTRAASPALCGVAKQGRCLLMYGAVTTVVSADTGEPLWTFSASPVATFPFHLKRAAGDASSTGQATPPATASYTPQIHASGLRGYSSRSHAYSGSYGTRQMAMLQHSYLQRTIPPQMLAARQRQPVRLVGPTTAWANAQGGVDRLGVLSGDHLLLLSPQGILAVHRDFPIVAAQLPQAAYGSYLGTLGQKVCLLRGDALLIADLAEEQLATLSLARVNADRGTLVRGFMQGARVYISGSNGLLCLNARTQKEIFFQAWSEDVAAAARDRVTQQAHYFLGGVHTGGASGRLPPVGLAEPNLLCMPLGQSGLVLLDATSGGTP
jgi:hypothetical protein